MTGALKPFSTMGTLQSPACQKKQNAFILPNQFWIRLSIVILEM